MWGDWLRNPLVRLKASRERRLLDERAIPDALWLDTLSSCPFLRWRSVEQMHQLRALSTLFLHRKEFSTTQGLVLTDEMAVAIAAQACMPVVELGLHWYDGFVGIVVSPDEVIARREWVDDDGIVHSGDEVLTGEAMAGGPMLLSWKDVNAAGDTAADGYNVVVHEFVHIIDLCDGVAADGIPPLPDAAARARWAFKMESALDRHRRELDSGLETWLDPYAATGPEEFFAVLAEAFFVAPRALQARWWDEYNLLREFFRQDPARFEL